ncbi:MAG: hypothetical protein ACK57N_05885 [Planctomycetia bacterium]
MRPLNLFTALCLATSSFLLPACGGGGGAANPPTTPEPVEVDLSLADLGLPPGVELVGGFDPLAEVYFLRAGHLVDQFRIRPTFAAEIGLVSQGDFQLDADGLALLLDEGLNEARFTIAAAATLEERVVRFSIERDRPDGLQQEHLVKSSGLKQGDGHGAALDILGDTMVVGSPFEDVTHQGATIPEAGAVYVYSRDGQGWREFARLQSPAPGTGDRFGASVAIFSNRMIVGAPGEDGEGVLDLDDINENAPDCGAAYTYRIGAATVDFERYLKPDAAIPRKTKGFGHAVAADGGLYFVGAPQEGTLVDPVLGVIAAPNAGAVHLFNANPAIQGSIGRIQAPDAAANQSFGSALGLDERRLAVGAPGANGARGKVYAFNPGNTLANFSLEAELVAPVGDLFDAFGASVDMDAGLLAIGAPLEDSGAEGIGGNQFDDSKVNSGAVYLFRRRPVLDGVEFELDGYIKGVGNLGGERFGTALDLRGDRLCVGAPLQRRPALGEAQGPIAPVRAVGAAFFYAHRNDVWDLGTTLTAPNAHEGAEFGAAVAMGSADLLIGSPKDRTFGQGIDASSVVVAGPGGGAVNNFR